MTISIALFEPRIPQNTGCIARTCAAFKIPLILIKPLGFSLEDKYLKRAGLDYWEYVNIKVYDSFNHFITNIPHNQRLIGTSKMGSRNYRKYSYTNNDILLFGREDLGLTENEKDLCTDILFIPMKGIANKDGKEGVRSLNLSVSVGIILSEAINSI